MEDKRTEYYLLSWIFCNTVSAAEVMKLPMKYAMITIDELNKCWTKWQDLF
jgi:hypothetical protein